MTKAVPETGITVITEVFVDIIFTFENKIIQSCGIMCPVQIEIFHITHGMVVCGISLSPFAAIILATGVTYGFFETDAYGGGAKVWLNPIRVLNLCAVPDHNFSS